MLNLPVNISENSQRNDGEEVSHGSESDVGSEVIVVISI